MQPTACTQPLKTCCFLLHPVVFWQWVPHVIKNHRHLFLSPRPPMFIVGSSPFICRYRESTHWFPHDPFRYCANLCPPRPHYVIPRSMLEYLPSNYACCASTNPFVNIADILDISLEVHGFCVGTEVEIFDLKMPKRCVRWGTITCTPKLAINISLTDFRIALPNCANN